MQRILVAVDFSDITDRVIQTAGELARGMGAKVWLMHCVNQQAAIGAMGDVPIIMPVPEASLSDRFPVKFRQLNQLAGTLRAQEIETEVLFTGGAVVNEISTAIEEHHIDLIVIGSHGHGALYDLVVGSVTKSVLYYTNKPVVIVPCEAAKAAAKSSEELWTEPTATPY